MSNQYTADLLTSEAVLAMVANAQWHELSTLLLSLFSDNVQRTAAFIRPLHIDGADAGATAAAGVHAAITGSNSAITTVTTAITNPKWPRNLTVTPGGTTTDVATGNVVIAGTNIDDEEISENFAFLANATAATVGAKAFKTITSITIPIQDGAAATFAIGYADKLGLPDGLERNTVLKAYLNCVLEDTAPTVALGGVYIENNTVDLASALDGNDVDIYYIVG